MRKIHLLNRVSLADFDVRVTTPIMASESSSLLQDRANKLNDERSASDLRAEIKYEVSPAIKMV